MGDGVSRGGLPGAGALILPAAPAWRALGCLLLAGAKLYGAYAGGFVGFMTDEPTITCKEILVTSL